MNRIKCLSIYSFVFLLMHIPLRFIRWVVKYINNETNNKLLFLLYTVLSTRRRFKQSFNIPLKFNRIDSLSIVNIYGNDRMGMTDRYKGMIITSKICKKYKFNHYIYHKHPFDLTDYLIPADNCYNWSLQEDIYNELIERKDSLFLEVSHLRNDKTQMFVLNLFLSLLGVKTLFLSISGVVSELEFGHCFNFLFKPSDNFLVQLTNFIKHDELYNYITVTFRFANLLGESNECIFNELPNEQKFNLINECIVVLNKIAFNAKEKNQKVYITSDSSYFLNIIIREKINNVVCFHINGVCNHIAFGGDVSNNSITKMMIEFFLITKANMSYQVKIGPMYNSGFPRYAASINHVEYKVINSIDDLN